MVLLKIETYLKMFLALNSIQSMSVSAGAAPVLLTAMATTSIQHQSTL